MIDIVRRPIPKGRIRERTSDPHGRVVRNPRAMVSCLVVNDAIKVAMINGAFH